MVPETPKPLCLNLRHDTRPVGFSEAPRVCGERRMPPEFGKESMKLVRSFRSSLPAFGISLLVLFPLVVLACSPASSSSNPGATTSTAASPTGYSISVVVNDKQTATLTPADLAKLPQVKQTVGGTEETGPTLLSSLASVGIKDFTQITIYGFTKGRVATAELTLARAQVTDNVMLALVARGTVKLTGTDIGSDKAVVDVNKMVVK